ncbi:MAG: SGNH/GDSL hydrolase family protein [Clostridia bacterium]|nr:SGNH/GDSL hydrolase family protein [Clostridia bacterium]
MGKKKRLSGIAFLVATIFCISGTMFSGCGGKNGDMDNNSKNFPYTVSPDEAVYAFCDDEIIRPFWKGNVIYNETVMPVKHKDGIYGKLQYTPVKILSVRNFDYSTEFIEGTDYTVNGNVISLTEDSAMPYLTEENLKGENVPAPYRQVSVVSDAERDFVIMGGTIYTEGSLVYGHQIAVSYVFDTKDINISSMPAVSGEGVQKVKAKLGAGEDVRITIIGDSVAEGCSSSGFFNRSPYMPNFIRLATDGLKRDYPDCDISLYNLARGGTTSDWGAANTQINAIIETAPDILFIHFGINDCGKNTGAGTYADNIESMVLAIKAAVKDCEIVIIKAFTPNPVSYNIDLFERYFKKADEIAARNEDVYTLDMYKLSADMLKTKKYFDLTGNGINHLNDYTSRLYAMAVYSMLSK